MAKIHSIKDDLPDNLFHPLSVAMKHTLECNTDKQAQRMILNALASEANKSDPKALTNLGILHIYGIGVEKSEKTALELFKQSSKIGCVAGLYNLGVLNHHGLAGLPPSTEEALNYYLQAAQSGDIHAMLTVAYLFGRGEEVKKSEEICSYWLNQAAAKGSLEAIQSLKIRKVI